VTLKEELGYLQLYLDIEKVRFGHRLDADFKVEGEAKKLLVPQLLIQPLLENAIKHGLYGVTDEVRIRFEARKQGGYLVISLENPFDDEHTAQSGAGFGLSSVARRLFLLYGRKDLLSTEKLSEVFRVNLKIPQSK